MPWIRLAAPFIASFLFAASAFAQEVPAPVGEPQGAVPEQYQQAAPQPPPPPVEPLPPVAAPEEEALAPNSIYAEGLGAGLLYSINYERLVVPQLGVRIGFSYMSFGASVSSSGSTSSSSLTSLTFPITASYLGVRSGSNVLELGGGATLVYASGTSSGGGLMASASGVGGFGVLMVGYRLHPLSGGGFLFRIGVMALLGPGLGFSASDPGAFGVLPWVYISLGGSF